jgi:CRP/FNR family transcriptional regulator, cyclic AMP receptor protein
VNETPDQPDPTTASAALVDEVALVARGDFFSTLPMYVVAAVVAASQHVSTAAGGTVMTEGEDGDCLFVVLSGSVDISVRGQVINRSASGDVLGELGLLVPGPCSATARCTTKSEFLRVDAAVLDELMLDYPEIGRGIITSLVRRLRKVGAVQP